MAEPEARDGQPRFALDPLLRARSLAVVGASGTPGSFGHALLRQLLDNGYAGAVYPVNPGRTAIDGARCYLSLADLPGLVDCAVLAVADERLEGALQEVAAARIPAAVVFGGIPTPGKGAALPDRLRRIAEDSGVALLGGNAMGFYNARDRLYVSGYPLQGRADAGGIAIVSHSGSSFSALANSGRGLRFSYLISPGQELILTAADYLQFLLEQPETRVIGLFLETVRDPDRFISSLERAAALEIPIVALKVGRSPRGREMALAHSGALAGSDEAFRAICERWGVIQVGSLDEMADTLELLASPRRVRGGGLALAGDSGGERALIVDRAAALGVPWADLGKETLGVIAAALDPGLEAANPLDLWGSGRDWQRIYETCLTAMATDPATGVVVLAVDLVRGSRLVPGYIEAAERVHAATETPIAIMGNLTSAIDPAAATRLRALGIPVLMGTDTALAALCHALTWRPAPAGALDIETDPAVCAYWWSVLSRRSTPLDEIESKRLLAAWGVPTIAERAVASETEAVAAAEALGWPVALKTAAPGVMHKSDVGGVALGLRDGREVVAAYRDLRQRLGPRAVVQRQAPMVGAVELFLGLTVDAQFGPLVTVGLGGVWVEALGDVAAALPPLSASQAEGLVHRLRGASLLTGARGRPAVDLAALANTIAAFSRMAVALGPVLAEIDVNPLLVGPAGVVALDALVVPRGATKGR
jgi:acyl-CoA synthetase (NDP forming)